MACNASLRATERAAAKACLAFVDAFVSFDAEPAGLADVPRGSTGASRRGESLWGPCARGCWELASAAWAPEVTASVAAAPSASADPATRFPESANSDCEGPAAP